LRLRVKVKVKVRVSFIAYIQYAALAMSRC